MDVNASLYTRMRTILELETAILQYIITSFFYLLTQHS